MEIRKLDKVLKYLMSKSKNISNTITQFLNISEALKGHGILFNREDLLGLAFGGSR